MVASGAHQSCSASCGMFGAFQNSARFLAPIQVNVNEPLHSAHLEAEANSRWLALAFDILKAWKARLELSKSARHACKTPDIALSTAENPTRRHLSRFSTRSGALDSFTVGMLRTVDVYRTLHVSSPWQDAGPGTD